jgi:stress response protein YsnF
VRRTPKRETRSVTETVRREVVKVETVGDVEEANQR